MSLVGGAGACKQPSQSVRTRASRTRAIAGCAPCQPAAGPACEHERSAPERQASVGCCAGVPRLWLAQPWTACAEAALVTTEAALVAPEAACSRSSHAKHSGVKRDHGGVDAGGDGVERHRGLGHHGGAARLGNDGGGIAHNLAAGGGGQGGKVGGHGVCTGRAGKGRLSMVGRHAQFCAVQRHGPAAGFKLQAVFNASRPAWPNCSCKSCQCVANPELPARLPAQPPLTGGGVKGQAVGHALVGVGLEGSVHALRQAGLAGG